MNVSNKGGVSGVGAKQAGGAPELTPHQQASVAAVQKAISSGKVDDPKLKDDIKAVLTAKTPEELHNAMHKLHADAKKDGIAMPAHDAKGAGKGKGGKAGGDGELGEDDLAVKGDGLKPLVMGSSTGSTGMGSTGLGGIGTARSTNAVAGSQFGLNGADSMFGADTFVKNGR